MLYSRGGDWTDNIGISCFEGGNLSTVIMDLAMADDLGEKEMEANLYNCEDFVTHQEAQACYQHCLDLGRGDVHYLDGDSDGIACEHLP